MKLFFLFYFHNLITLKLLLTIRKELMAITIILLFRYFWYSTFSTFLINFSTFMYYIPFSFSFTLSIVYQKFKSDHRVIFSYYYRFEQKAFPCCISTMIRVSFRESRLVYYATKYVISAAKAHAQLSVRWCRNVRENRSYPDEFVVSAVVPNVYMIKKISN